MELSSDKDLGNKNDNSAILPSLFSNHAVVKDGLLVLNDSSLTQQIEFILHDAPIDNNNEHHSTLYATTPPHYQFQQKPLNNRSNINNKNNINYHKSVQCAAETTVINQNVTLNPPNNCASDNNVQQQHQQSEQIACNNKIINNNNAQQQQIHQVLNARRIIIHSTRQIQQPKQHINSTTQLSCAQDDVDILLEDPELNDENLQDIEEETQESEAELRNHDEHLTHEQQTQYQTIREIKLEYEANESIENAQQYITNNNENNTTATQLILPSTIVSTTRSASDLTSALQRRPVYIREVSTNADGAIVSMSNNAVIRNGSMALLNLAQSCDSQLIHNSDNSPASIGTSVVVTPSPNVSIVPLQTISSGQVFTAISGNQNTSVIADVELCSNYKNNNNSGNSAVLSLVDGYCKNSSKTKSGKKTSASKIRIESVDSNGSNEPNSTSAGAYQCIDCPERFDAKDIFDIHRSGHLNNMKCAICNMVLKSLKNYEKHCLRCKPYECQICGRIIRFRPNFIKHMRVHTACQAAERHKYKCEVCHKEFMSFEYFKVHKKIHSENVNLTCEICGKVFSALASLRGHSKLHSGHKLHKCDVCGKGFGQRYNLKIHARTHTGDFPYECTTCKKKLHTEKALETHMKMHHRQLTSNQTSLPLSRNRSNTKYKTKNNLALTTCEIVNNNNNHDNNSNRNDNVPYERPSTSGLQQLCAIASDNLKNFHSQVDSTTSMYDNSDIEGFSNDSVAVSLSQEAQYNDEDNDHLINNIDLKKQNENNIEYNNANCNSAEGKNIENGKKGNYSDVVDKDDEPTTSIRASARTIVINNFVQNNYSNQPNVNSVHPSNAIYVNTQSGQFKKLQKVEQKQLSRKHQIIHSYASTIKKDNNNSFLKQELMRNTLSSQTAAMQFNVHDTDKPHSLAEQNESCSSTMVITSTGNVVGMGSPTLCTIGQRIVYSSPMSTTIMSINNNNNSTKNIKNQSPHEATIQASNNHRNNQQSPDRDISLDVDDAHVIDTHDIENHAVDGNSCNNVMANDDATIMPISSHEVPTIHNHRHQNHSLHHNHHSEHKKTNCEHFDDDTNDDDKSSPSLATTAIIKQEPNFYSSCSVDNSNEMLIKEEVMFEDSTADNSPRLHSPLSSKYCITNFDTDHHGGPMDLNHSLPPYGHLFEQHSIPGSIPFSRIDDSDFQLDHNSLGGLHNASNSTTDGEFIKKEWVYGADNNFNMSSKFDDDSDPMCESGSLIYN